MKIFGVIVLPSVLVIGMQANSGAPALKRIYVEEHIKTTAGGSTHCDTYGNCYGSTGTHSRDVSLEVTRELVKKCPDLLTVTDNLEASDYTLRISPGSSTLFKQNSDVAYISPTRFKVSNLAKDVCSYVHDHSVNP